MLIPVDVIPQCDGRTDGRTNGQRDGIVKTVPRSACTETRWSEIKMEMFRYVYLPN